MTAFEVDLAGLLGVFGGHLYSEPGVFVRELVQNAADAIVLRRASEPDHAGAIVVRVEPGAVVFEDDGAGLDEDAVTAALGRIGHSTKRGAAPAGTSGRFGIGLLSGFLVAAQLVVTTRAADRPALRWIGRLDGTWSIEPATRDAVGTSVRLELVAEHAGFADTGQLAALLRRHVRYLPIALTLAGPDGARRIDERPPWREADALAAARNFAEERGSGALVASVVAAPATRGLLWIHPERAQPDGGRVALYQHGILVEEAARDLLPAWASFVSGAIETSALAPTASRETYVRDAAAAAVAAALRDHLLRWLAALPRDVPAFDRVLALHATHLRGACANSPELLDAIGDHIALETNFGEVDLPTLRAATGGDRALRVADSPQSFAHVAPLATAQGVPVINACYLHDRPFVEAWARRRKVELAPLDVESLAIFLRPAPEAEARFHGVLAQARALLAPLDVEPEVGRFEPGSMPAFLVTEPTALRERARALVRGASSALSRDLLRALPVARADRGIRFVLNVDNPLVAALPDAADVALAAHAVRLLYAQSAMLVRRTLSLAETRVFSDDLRLLLTQAVGGAGGPRGAWN